MEILSACRGGMQLLLKNLRHYLAGGGVASAAVTPSLLLRLAFRFRDAVVVPRGAFEHDPFLVGSPRVDGQAIEEFSRGIGPRVARAAEAPGEDAVPDPSRPARRSVGFRNYRLPPSAEVL